jgi:hypothetical protein
LADGAVSAGQWGGAAVEMHLPEFQRHRGRSAAHPYRVETNGRIHRRLREPWRAEGPVSRRSTRARMSISTSRRQTGRLALCEATLHVHASHVRVPTYDRSALTPGIVRLGVGVFHRAHQAVYLDDLADRGGCSWGVTTSAGSGHVAAYPEPPRLPRAGAVRARPQPRPPEASRCPSRVVRRGVLPSRAARAPSLRPYRSARAFPAHSPRMPCERPGFRAHRSVMLAARQLRERRGLRSSTPGTTTMSGC